MSDQKAAVAGYERALEETTPGTLSSESVSYLELISVQGLCSLQLCIMI